MRTVGVRAPPPSSIPQVNHELSHLLSSTHSYAADNDDDDDDDDLDSAALYA